MPFLIPKIDEAQWIGPQSLRVRFSSPLVEYQYQLYAGRRLIGETTEEDARVIIGQLVPFTIPEHLSVMAVTGDEAGQDFGSLLPARPYARTEISFSTTGWPDDTKWIDILSGTVPGGAVDANNRIGRINFDGVGDYSFLTEPQETGTWNYQITGRDNKPDSGNPGTAASASVAVLAYPPDVFGSKRLSVSATAGVASINWSY